MAIAHCNNICVHKWRQQLLADGVEDSDIEAFGTWEARLHEILGLETSEWQRQQWLQRAT